MQPNLSHLYEATPIWLDSVFVATTFLALGMLYLAIRRISRSRAWWALGSSVAWLAILALLAYHHFFQQFDARPPHFMLAIGPPLLLLIGLLTTHKGRIWVNLLPLSTLTRLHLVRIPVELTLFGLYVYHQIPRLMTFEGRNYDILAGLTAPIIAYYAFNQKRLSARWLLLWNILALGLVLNIVGHAILSAPFQFQQLAFDQPNVGILKAPYIWLPGFIVPAVLFSHAVVILRLVKEF